MTIFTISTCCPLTSRPQIRTDLTDGTDTPLARLAARVERAGGFFAARLLIVAGVEAAAFAWPGRNGLLGYLAVNFVVKAGLLGPAFFVLFLFAYGS